MSGQPDRATRRVFFALWPDGATRSRLAELAAKAHAAFGGRRMRAETLHMTLAFLGEIPSERVEAAMLAGDELSAMTALSMHIDQLRCWHHNRIVWCGPQAAPAALADGAAELAGRLAAAGFRLDKRPFAAHATLLRNADCDALPPSFEPFDWPVREIVLVESDLAAAASERYKLIGRWPLRSRAD